MVVLEMFCERCGARQAPDEVAPTRTAGEFARRLMTAVRGTTADGLGAPASEAFLRLCLSCRGYSCPTCWNEAQGTCQTCAPLPEVIRPVMPPTLPDPPTYADPPVSAAPPAFVVPPAMPAPPVAPPAPQPSLSPVPARAPAASPGGRLRPAVEVAPALAARHKVAPYPSFALPPPAASTGDTSIVRPCRTCLLPLSASAHFCRRCGSSQD